MELPEHPLTGPRALTFGLVGGLLSWAVVIAGALFFYRMS
jgi:hypothetical protein